MCALEFRCRFEKAMTTPSLGITILVVQKKERATGSHSVTFLQPALSGLFTDEVIDQTAVAESLSFINSNEWIAYTSAHLFPVRPPYLILFYFFLLLCICFVCTRLYFSAGRKGKEEEKKSNTSALMAVRVSRQRTKKEKPPCRFGRPTVSQPRHDIVDLIGQAVSERHLYIIF